MQIGNDIFDVVESVLRSMSSGKIENYIAPGLESYLLGRENSKVRMFCNTRPQDFHISPHSHRFDFFSIVLRGWARNHMYVPYVGGNQYHVFEYRPKVRFSTEFEAVPMGHVFYRRETTHYPAGQAYAMRHDEFHSIEFSQDAMVLFFEGPMIRETSFFLEPMVNGKTIPLFTVPDWMYKP